MGRMDRSHARWMTTLAAVASIAFAASGSAQTVPPSQPAPGVNQDLAKQHLTAARNTLSDVTQLPAAAQLTGEARTQVQELISNFNELISTGSDWRRAYAKVESNLAALLTPDAPAPVSRTAGPVGTSGTVGAIDPAIRSMLVEFRAYLQQFELVASGDASPSQAAPPGPMPPAAATPPPTSATRDTRPSSGVDDQGVTHELLLHVEAVEVILGAQTAAQRAATAAAGGAVVTTQTASGSTRTTITGPDVTLNAAQLEQISTHLREIRRLLERK